MMLVQAETATLARIQLEASACASARFAPPHSVCARRPATPCTFRMTRIEAVFLTLWQEVQLNLRRIDGNRSLKLTLSRQVFEHMCQDLFQKCLKQVDKLLADKSGDWPTALMVNPHPNPNPNPAATNAVTLTAHARRDDHHACDRCLTGQRAGGPAASLAAAARREPAVRAASCSCVSAGLHGTLDGVLAPTVQLVSARHGTQVTALTLCYGALCSGRWIASCWSAARPAWPGSAR